MLATLGFGPETRLMTEPQIFTDSGLLSALIVELEDELGYRSAARTLFLIGLTHGLRDADRAVFQGLLSLGEGSETLAACAPTVRTAVPMDLAVPLNGAAGHEISGTWPERFEAGVWISKFGPTDDASCWLSAGYTSGWLSGTLGADILALESSCTGCGDEACRFVAREIAGWEAAAPHAQRNLLGPVDFEVFRALALSSPASPPELIESQGSFDPDAALVHIWGPVMVLPFTDGDQILRTAEALSRDPGTSEVSAVVVDLRGAVLDDDFGAAAVERVLGTIESWGAEPVLTGVSPLTIFRPRPHHLVGASRHPSLWGGSPRCRLHLRARGVR